MQPVNLARTAKSRFQSEVQEFRKVCLYLRWMNQGRNSSGRVRLAKLDRWGRIATRSYDDYGTLVNRGQ